MSKRESLSTRANRKRVRLLTGSYRNHRKNDTGFTHFPPPKPEEQPAVVYPIEVASMAVALLGGLTALGVIFVGKNLGLNHAQETWITVGGSGTFLLATIVYLMHYTFLHRP